MSFLDDIEAWTFKAQNRVEYASKRAVVGLAEDANMTRNGGGQESQGPMKPGRMSWRTGFLHNSMAAQEGSPPSGPSVGPRMVKGGFELRDPMGDPKKAERGIMSWTFNSPMYVGWTADYAQKHEAYSGFMWSVVQHWESTYVPWAVGEAKALFP